MPRKTPGDILGLGLFILLKKKILFLKKCLKCAEIKPNAEKYSTFKKIAQSQVSIDHHCHDSFAWHLLIMGKACSAA